MKKNAFIIMLTLIFSASLLVLLNSSTSNNSEAFINVFDRETAPSKLEQLIADIEPLVESTPAYMTVILADQTTGETVTLNNDRDYVAASLYKLFVAYYAYDQIDQGNITLGTTLSNDKTLDRCLDVMITISDNECGVLLGDLFGWANIDVMLYDNGFTETTLNTRNTGGDIMTTPNDVNLFLTRLNSGQLMAQVHTEHLTKLLINQEINNRLPPVIPSNITVGHKTGDVYDHIHDAGLIYTENDTYSFVIMSADWSEDMLFGPGYEYFQEIFTTIFNNLQ